MNSSFEEELNRSGTLIYTNTGDSMLPLLRQGKDVLVIEKAAAYHRFDAVLFRRVGVPGSNRYILHRILKICPDGRYWIAGDNRTIGEYVAKEQILGVLTAVNRGGRLIKATDLRYRLYVRLWCAPYHFRFFILNTRRYIRLFPGIVKGWLNRHGF